MPKPILFEMAPVADVHPQQMEMTGMRRLACAVLIAAVADLQRGTTGRPSFDAGFQSAKELLCRENPDLEFWCALSGLNRHAVMDRALMMIKTGSKSVSELKKSGRYSMDLKGAPIDYGAADVCQPQA